MKRTGTANLPLHGGKAPRWLFARMVRLAGALTDHLVYEYGPDEVLRRLSDPYWFQAFSCVLGFDWHSSGTTTTACGALKMAVDPQRHGLLIAGGKGASSRKAPAEIAKGSTIFNFSARKVESLQYASKMSAKVDNSCVQDGFQLYHHLFLTSEKGNWCVIQQGMQERWARRYHWLSSGISDYVDEPHAGIACDMVGKEVLDLTARESERTREVSVDLVKDNPVHLYGYLKEGARQTSLADFSNCASLPKLNLPAHHPVLELDLTKKDKEVLHNAYEIQPTDYEELVSITGMGAKKLRALALISDLVYGSKASWRDPVKYSFTHGGKDGFPYPVNREVYDHSIQTLKDALQQAKIGEKDRYHAIKRLQQFL